MSVDPQKRERIQSRHPDTPSFQFTETMMLFIMLERAHAVIELLKIVASLQRNSIVSPTGGDIDMFGNLPPEV